MTRRLVIVMTVLVAVVSVALAVPMGLLVANDQRAAFVSGLEVDTLAIASQLSSSPFELWAKTAAEAATTTGARVVVVDIDRNLIVDSDNSSLDRSFDRPEINSALGGFATSDVRFSQTLKSHLRFVAAPIVQDLGVVAAVRLSLPETNVDHEIQETRNWLLLFVATVVLAAGLVAWLVARSIAAPLLSLAVVARELPENLSLRASESKGPEEVRAVGHALNETAEKLDGMIHRTQRVAADASHHLRTPLTGVRLRLEAIEDITTEDVVRTEAQAATAEVDRLTRRIEQVLALARSDAGGTVEHPVDMSAIVTSRIEAASYLAEEKGISIRTAIDSNITVQSGPGVVARVVDELLGNAMNYARSSIDISIRAVEEFAVLNVDDDGPGILDTEYEGIFERFVRGAGGVPGGSGLGLSLVREAARTHGGDAIASRSKEGGLRVVITWQRAQ